MDMRLEVVVLPVSDVDRARDFYLALGWRLDADFPVEDFRVVQLTPPGSACSVIFGTGVTAAAPGSAQGLQLVVSDIEVARAELAGRGAQVSDVFHDATGIFHHAGDQARVTGRRRTTRAMARGHRSATRTGTAGTCRRSAPGCRAAKRRRSPCSTRWRAWPRRCAGRPPHTASTRRRPGRPTRTGRTGTPSTWRTRPRGMAAHERLRLRRDREGGGPPRRALCRGARRGRAARRRGRAGAGGRRVLVLGVHPVQDAAAARRGRVQAREAAGKAEVDVAAALAYRDFMVSNYSDAGAQSLARRQGHRPDPRHRPSCRARRGRGGRTRHTAEHVVVATGADPVIPPIPGLRELEGVWTNREVTGMKAVPRRLVIIGGGPVGVEMAQAVRRLGGEVVLAEGAPHLLAREPAPLGQALGEVLGREGIELFLGVRVTAARRDGDDYVLVLGDGRELRGDRLLAATGRRPRTGRRGPGHRPGHRRAAPSARRRAPARRGAAAKLPRRHRDPAAHSRGQVPGRGRGLQPPRRAARGALRGHPGRDLHRPGGRRRRRQRGPVQRDRAAVRRWPGRPPTPTPTPSPRAS